MTPNQAAVAVAQYGSCLTQLNRYEQAESALRDAYRRLTQPDQQNTDMLRVVLAGLAQTCEHTNRPDEASRWRAELAALKAATQSATRP
jgi:predicted Zn-dependent protease